jgi:phage-related tail fiber protein
MIHTSGIQRVLNVVQSELTHIAVGTGTAPSASAIQLTNETFRKPISTTLIDGDVLVSEIFFDENEGNGAISEIGLLTSTNVLFSSGGASFTKDSTESLTVSFEIEIKEVR